MAVILVEQNKLTKTFIHLRGVQIYCEYVLNEKPPLILLHGFVSSTYTFHKLIPLLANHFSIVAIDLPGFGRSEKSRTFIYSFEQYAALVSDCIRHFQLTNAILAGHSMGGQIALYTAKYVPEKISKLILFASSGYLKPAKKWLIYCTYLPFFHLITKLYIEKETVLENLQNVLYDHSLITDELIEEYERPIREKAFSKSLTRLLRYREGDLSSQQLAQIKQPTLLLWGEKDRVVPLEIGRKLATDLPNAKLTTYKKTGHLLTEEKPTEIYEQILAFSQT